MNMDPITSLSIAAAAIQFADFSSKLVSKSRELYRSADGVLQEDKEARTVAMRLNEMVQALQRGRYPRLALTNDANTRLQALCVECAEISTILVDRLHQIEVSSTTPHRKWKSFRQALKSVWNKREIDAMARKITQLRAELDTEIIVLMRYEIIYSSA